MSTTKTADPWREFIPKEFAPEEDVIVVFSCAEGVTDRISTEGFTPEMEVATNPVLKQWYEHDSEQHWRYGSLLSRATQPKQFLKGSGLRGSLLYYEYFNGTMRCSYDALYAALQALKKHIEEDPFYKDKSDVVLYFPHSNRSDIDMEIRNTIAAKVFSDKRYRFF